jgi:Putative Flp pilus-assembly TadE/G-like
MAAGGHRYRGRGGERGQASLLFLGLLAALFAGTLALFGLGQALGARSKHQRAADLAAVSAAQVMSGNYTRLFEPAVFENGLPNPHHLSNEQFLALARAAASRGARRNGVAAGRMRVEFPGGGFAPTRVKVETAGEARLRLSNRSRAERIPVRASAAADITPRLDGGLGMPASGSGGGYDGPLAYRMGKADAPRRGGRVRPHGRRSAPRGRALPVDQLGLSLRRRAAAALERQPQSQVGGAAGHEPAPLGHRARPGPARRLRLAMAKPPQVRLHPKVRLGTPGISGCR